MAHLAKCHVRRKPEALREGRLAKTALHRVLAVKGTFSRTRNNWKKVLFRT